MQITNDEAVKAKQALDKLCEKVIPVSVSMELAVLSNEIDGVINAFAKVRQGLFTKYQIKQERRDDGSVGLSSTIEGGVAKFAEDFDELLQLTNKIADAPKIKLPETINVEASVLKSLIKFVSLG